MFSASTALRSPLVATNSGMSPSMSSPSSGVAPSGSDPIVSTWNSMSSMGARSSVVEPASDDHAWRHKRPESITRCASAFS